MQKTILQICLFPLLFSACVTPKVHNALIADNEAIKTTLRQQEEEQIQLEAKLTDIESKTRLLKNKIFQLKNDSVQNGGALVVLQNKYDELSESYDLLAAKNSRNINQKAKEIKQLLEQLEQAQIELLQKQDQLEKTSNSLKKKEEALELAKVKLDARSEKVTELQSIITKKDSVVSDLKNSISNALSSLEGDGLSIEERDGRVYLSLEEDLLFASGRYEINTKGVAALEKLADVLELQKGVEILVEGHTDSIPLNGNGLLQDNWDLSVKRATSVVKVLIQNNNLDPAQLIAAGRADFVPISTNKTKEGRSKNRRIEMILSPNLDDLFRILEE